MITGNTEIIALIGYPTYSFTSPMIYNPYFDHAGINAVVVPMGCKAEAYPSFLSTVFQLTNLRGALITMPHKVATVALVDEVTAAVRVAGACNAVRRTADGRLQGDLFDGEGFVRGMRRKGWDPKGARALVVGCGGVGSAIAASLAGAGVAALRLFDMNEASASALAQRLRENYPAIQVETGTRDPHGCQLVVNASPLGMAESDPLPLDVERIPAGCFVGEVVLSRTYTPLLLAAQARGCTVQVGTDMLFEQIPAYLEYFDFPTTTAEELRRLAQLEST
jgi:shikimate dehydrogenase